MQIFGQNLQYFRIHTTRVQMLQLSFHFYIYGSRACSVATCKMRNVEYSKRLKY